MNVKHDLWNLKDAGIFTARRVIVATGPHEKPYTPSFATKLDGAVLQVHSNVSCDPVLGTSVTHQT